MYVMKDSFCKELERIFDKFPKCHMNILFGDSIPREVGKIFSNKQLGMRVCTKISNDNGARVVTSPHPKI
jgi:hypothetical protein